MRLDARVLKLETGRRPVTADYDFSVLDDDELRLIDAISFDSDGRVNFGSVSPENLEWLGRVMAKLEASGGVA